MPSRFLSKAERNRLSRFASEVSDNDCIVYFTLTPADLQLIQQRRGDENYLGFALLLCSLRYLGHFPSTIHQAPKNVIQYVADQLKLLPTSLKEYAERKETRWEHYPIILEHLGFRRTKEGWTCHFTCPVFWVVRPILQAASLKKRDGIEIQVPFFGPYVSFFRTRVSKNETPKGTRLVSKRPFCLDFKVPNAPILP